jgi:hypothetical protein
MRILPMLLLGSLLIGSGGCALLGTQRETRESVAPAASPEIRQAQLVLQQQGTYTGRVDGIPGPATQESIRLYQQAHKLDATGQLDNATRTSLRLRDSPATERPQTQMADGSKMSESDARKLIESQGFTKVTDLYRDDSAVWRGMASRGGKTSEVAIDAKGNVVTN